MLDSNQVQPVISSVVTPVALEGFKTPLLNEYPGASAAYSLRRLKSWDDGGRVVQVRRASDNEHRDFSAADIESGALVDWVNEIGVIRNRTGGARWTTVTPTATGFDASTVIVGACGYDLYGSSGDSVTVTFDVLLNSGSFTVQLRNGFESGSTVSNSETISTSGSKSFTLTSSADFVALQFISASADIEVTNFSINTPWTNDAFVPTWYDQSGNANDATQAVVTSQPKIVDAGVLVTGGIDFDGVDDSFTLTNGLTIDPSTSGFSSFIATKFDKAATGSAQVFLRNGNLNPKHSISFNTNGTFRYNLNDGTNNLFADTASDYGDNSLSLFSTIITGQSATGLTHFVDGSQDGQFDTSSMGDTGSTADTISWPAFPFGGVVQEIIFYPSDQSANRAAIETNINTKYSIY